MNRILVVGGQGNVGSQITEYLIKVCLLSVDVSSRRGILYSKSLKILANKPKVIQLDLNIVSNYDFLDNYKAVIMCIDNYNAEFFYECIKRDLLYIDITANMNIITQSKLTYNSILNKSTVIFGVGLSPGFTNLLANKALKDLKENKYCHISMIIGTGDKHGNFAVDWLVNQLKDNYVVKIDGELSTISPYIQKRNFKLLSSGKKYSAYNLNFCDQHIIDEIHMVETISTNIAYSSNALTGVMHIIAKIGVFKLLRFDCVQRFFVNIIKNINFGSKSIIIHVEASGKKFDLYIKRYIEVKGEDESKITSRIASDVLLKSINLNNPGFHYMSELFDIDDFKNILSEHFDYYDNTVMSR